MSTVGVMEITPTVEMSTVGVMEIIPNSTNRAKRLELSLHLQYSYGTPPLRRNVAW